MISPGAYGPVDAQSGVYDASKIYPDLSCSLSDPFLVISIEEQGCPQWFAQTSLGFVASTLPVVDLSPNRRALAVSLLPGGTASYLVDAFCQGSVDNEVAVGFGYQAGSKGINYFDLSGSSKLSEPIEKLLPLPGDQLLAVGHRTAVPIQRDASGAWSLGTISVTADGRARVYVAGTRVVLKDACDGFGCPYDLANIYTWEVGGSTAGVNAFSASTQFLGMLGDKLAFYQSKTPDGTQGQIVLWDAAFEIDELPLAVPAFPAEPELLPGFPTPTGLGYLAFGLDTLGNYHFWRVDIDAATQTTSVADLGVSGAAASARVSPDGTSFVYWGTLSGGGCVVGLRDLQTGMERWTQSLCSDASVPPVFLPGGRVAVLLSDQLVALDLQTGSPQWSWNRMVNGLSIPVTSMVASGAALIVTTAVPGGARVQAIGAAGEPRLGVPIPLAGSGFVASEQFLVGALGQTLVTVESADNALDAPPHVCTLIDCGQGTVDVAADAANCGQCGKRCDAGQSCFSGSCAEVPTL